MLKVLAWLPTKHKVHENSPQKLGKCIRLMKSPNSNLGFGSFGNLISKYFYLCFQTNIKVIFWVDSIHNKS